MKMCPLTQRECQGRDCAWSVNVLADKEYQTCAIAVIAVNLNIEDGYYTVNLNLRRIKNELTTNKNNETQNKF